MQRSGQFQGLGSLLRGTGEQIINLAASILNLLRHFTDPTNIFKTYTILQNYRWHKFCFIRILSRTVYLRLHASDVIVPAEDTALLQHTFQESNRTTVHADLNFSLCMLQNESVKCVYKFVLKSSIYILQGINILCHISKYNLVDSFYFVPFFL